MLADFSFRPPKIFGPIFAKKLAILNDGHFGKNGFWDTAILVVFWRFLWDKTAKLSLIDFKIGLPIILKVNDGQNKFELHISKDSAKIASFWPKICQLPLERVAF